VLAAVSVMAVVGAGVLTPLVDAQARQKAPRAVDGSVGLSSLPAEGQATYRSILAGGPFASRKDGSVFGNLERILPGEPRGFYREYTVATPGARDRGARRIVCGGQPPTRPSACYYTADHYATFRQIAP
jgi:ribonuclease T1